MSSASYRPPHSMAGGIAGAACLAAAGLLYALMPASMQQQQADRALSSPSAFVQPGDSALHEVQAEMAEKTVKQNRIARFIADEWDLGSDYARTVVKAAFKSAERYQLDPIMLLAIAGKESAFRHIGSNPYNTYGIMQVIGRYHKDKFEGGKVVATDVTENIDLGAKVVREYLDIENGNERRALMRYNGSERKESYSRSVTALKKKLLRALQRSEEEDDDS